MNWSDVPFSIEVSRSDGPWECVARIKSDPLAQIAAAKFWKLVYDRYPNTRMRIIEAARNKRVVVRIWEADSTPLRW